MGTSTVNCRGKLRKNAAKAATAILHHFFSLFVFVLIHYGIDVYALVSCLIIVMVGNAEDDSGETKPNFVEKFGDVKPPKVEAKPNIDGASVHVEASKYVDSGVLPLHVNEVDTARFLSDYMNCLIGHVVKQLRRDLQLLHKDQA